MGALERHISPTADQGDQVTPAEEALAPPHRELHWRPRELYALRVAPPLSSKSLARPWLFSRTSGSFRSLWSSQPEGVPRGTVPAVTEPFRFQPHAPTFKGEVRWDQSILQPIPPQAEPGALTGGSTPPPNSGESPALLLVGEEAQFLWPGEGGHKEHAAPSSSVRS